MFFFCFIEAVSPSVGVPAIHVRRVLFTNHELLEHKVYTLQKRTVGSRLVLGESLNLEVVATVSRAALPQCSVPVHTLWPRE